MSVGAARSYTWAEIAKHRTQGDCWIVVRGKVYDVTQWMHRHPGGRDVLLCAAGRDVTNVFDSYHQLATEKMLHKFEVGVLATNELPVFPARSKFNLTLRQRVEAYFRDNNLDPKHAPWMWVRYACIFSTLAVCWYAQLVLAPVSFALALLPALVLGWCGALIGLMPMHDGSHFSTTHSPLVWKLLGGTHDFFNGASYLVWLYQHMLGHHAYTNIDGADPDIDYGDGDIRRIKGSQPWYMQYLYQHLYGPVIYGLLGMRTRAQDINILHVLKTDGPIRVNEPTTSQLAVFWAGKVFHVIYRLVVPALFLPLWQVVVLYAVADAVSSYWLAILFQANHVVSNLAWPKPDKRGVVNMDWAEMQVVTSQDYAHGSWFWTVFSGSLNYQVVHHLFPGINQFYYPMIAPIVMRTCAEYGVQYTVQKTAAAAIWGHFAHLYTMGRAH
eukprot:Unigene4834_Nuclearia_a/m.14782 Unigene4834_Nuclearia_a/g.14782  ORF Unigene4834_Nuclearia_a/g.14782 Unigene4834_Nuclearia_a/m.14782 type:complete len:441 (+) Unigene4834_Nuclearia_a:492-1814(+)